MKKSLRVCYFGAYRAEYSRNRILIAGLRRNGVTVVECQTPLWQGVADRVQAVKGKWRRPGFWWRVLRTYVRLLWLYFCTAGDYDVLVVGYPGQFDVYLARLLSWLRDKPLVWDIFMSIYLIALERGLAAQAGATVAMLRRVEWLACRLPDRLLLDTENYITWFCRTHNLKSAAFRLIPTGADSDNFRRLPLAAPHDGLRLIYYGSYIPNHGVQTIVAAARLLAADDVQFVLIGDGPERAQAEADAAALQNITFVDWLDQTELALRVAAADVVLGAFGVTPQSLMTVQNKIYEGLALGRPVLSGDGPAVRAALHHGEEIFLCPRADPVALAAAIRTLQADGALRQRLADQGHARFLADFTIEALGARFKAHLLEVQESFTRGNHERSRYYRQKTGRP